MTKAELYRWVGRKRGEYGLFDLPVRAPELVRACCPDIALRERDFSTRAVGGLLLLGKVSLLCLNTRRSAAEQNFDCAHELIHYWSGGRHFALTPGGQTPRQDAYIEWMANEGAAELLMPYRRVVPLFHHERLARLGDAARRERLRALAEQFLVTPAQMEYRLRSLRVELSQYARELSCPKIVPQSRRQTVARITASTG